MCPNFNSKSMVHTSLNCTVKLIIISYGFIIVGFYFKENKIVYKWAIIAEIVCAQIEFLKKNDIYSLTK
jgi:hypothetical protein